MIYNGQVDCFIFLVFSSAFDLIVNANIITKAAHTTQVNVANAHIFTFLRSVAFTPGPLFSLITRNRLNYGAVNTFRYCY